MPIINIPLTINEHDEMRDLRFILNNIGGAAWKDPDSQQLYGRWMKLHAQHVKAWIDTNNTVDYTP